MYKKNIKNTVQGLFFILLGLLGFALSYWQYCRAQQVSVRDQQVIHARTLVLINSVAWEGQYYQYALAANQNGRFLVPLPLEGEYVFGNMAWISFFDEKSELDDGSFETVFEAGRVMNAHVLKKRWSEHVRASRKMRHYGYSVQWMILSLISLWYARKFILYPCERLL